LTLILVARVLALILVEQILALVLLVGWVLVVAVSVSVEQVQKVQRAVVAVVVVVVHRAQTTVAYFIAQLREHGENGANLATSKVHQKVALTLTRARQRQTGCKDEH